ncbi:Nucleolar, Nop [Parasponia andersonii]|uniref:Nucleolar, Nop n=1 Tax=Parasponia andersonii TaxID=3476 RepID=A0A2P5E1Z2_PARAD|nr:Nucleolar, Nop [Parasponia andersonii]
MEEERAEVGLSSIKRLASCDKSIRDKALSFLLKTWLPAQTHVSEDLMKKLWKGLFYCFWHSDKVPAQSEIADSISSLFPKLDLPLSIHFLSVFFLTMRREWTGIDALRLDKFYLLIRRFVHSFFVLLKSNSWDLELSRRLMGVLEERTLLADDKFQGNGVNYHIVSIFLDELRPFLPIGSEVVDVLFKPFLSVMAKLPDKVLLGKIKSSIFEELLKKGKELLEVKKSGENVDSSSVVVLLGSMALTMGFSGKFYELGSSPECCQGNRKVLFSLHEEFSKLEKDLASSGIEVSTPDAIEHDEEEAPNLISITAEIEASASEPVEAMEDGRMSLKKCAQGKASGGGDEASKKSKKKKKNESIDSDPEKSSKVKINKNEADANGDESVSDPNFEGDIEPLDESVISNLQLQFERIAAESGLDDNVPSSCDLLKSAKSSTASKKRKRARSMDGKQSQNSLQIGEEDAKGATAEKSAKKVKFSMKSNLIWKPHNPLPPQSLRLPPSVTPRGSALKKGVPPGPIREIPSPARKVKLRAVSVKKARKPKGVKRLKKIKSISA